ncbi:Uncharacterised protein [Mycobacteroides abscessus]|nr:Uncharacterised protein [Mycobacteroides abscessus]
MRDLAREVRPRDDGDALGSQPERLRDDLAHAPVGAQLDALHEGHRDGVGRHVRAELGERLARDLGGHRDDDEPGARERLGRVGRGADPLGEVDARQPLLVAARGVHLLGDLGVAAPEAHLAPGVGQDGGERGAPAAGPEDGGDDALGAHARSSVPGRRRRSNRSAGACSPRISSSWLVIAAMMRSVASRSVAVSCGRS